VLFKGSSRYIFQVLLRCNDLGASQVNLTKFTWLLLEGTYYIDAKAKSEKISYIYIP